MAPEHADGSAIKGATVSVRLEDVVAELGAIPGVAGGGIRVRLPGRLEIDSLDAALDAVGVQQDPERTRATSDDARRAPKQKSRDLSVRRGVQMSAAPRDLTVAVNAEEEVGRTASLS